MTTYPAPDRSNYRPNRVKTAENDQLDIGWNEGTLTDGRPFRVECWCQDQITCLTYFLSREGLEELTREEAADMLEREELLVYKTDDREAYPVKMDDASGQPIWSINVVVGIEDEPPRIWDTLTLKRYH